MIENSKSIKGDLEDMKNFRKRKNGLWEARLTINGERRSFYARTFKECKEKLIQFKKTIKKRDKKEITPTFYNFALTWFDTYKKTKLSNKTIQIYTGLIEHLKPLQIELSELTLNDLQSFLNTFPKTRTKEMLYIMVKAIIRKAYMLDYIKKDLSIGLEKGMIIRKETSAYSLEEQKTILNNLSDDKFSKLILTYLLTGIRKNEALTIQHEDIKNGFIYIRGTKTHKAKRFVKISQKLQNILIAIDTDPIFNYSSEYIATKLKRFGKKIDLTPFGFHKLRHTFASNLYYLGVRDKERQEYMGHTSSVLTNDVYTHFDPTITKEDIINIFKDWYPTF